MPETHSTALASSAPRSGPRAGWNVPSRYAETVHRVAFWAFLSSTALACAAALADLRPPPGWSWVYGVQMAAAAFTMLAILARSLPVQNVVACGLVLTLTSGMALALGANTGFPIGKFQFEDGLGPRLLGLVSWPAPLLWLAVLLASRQTAKVVLLPWRRNRQYGWWLLGAATGLALIATLALEPFGHRVMGWWSWPAVGGTVSWYGTPPVVFAGTVGLSLVLLLLVTPWLVPKRRTGRTPDFEPVWVWGGLVAWFALGNLRSGLWLTGVLAVVCGGAVGWLAWRSSRFSLNSPKSGGASV